MFLTIAAFLVLFVSLAHSYLGEKYILQRLFRRELPPLFGNDLFTKQTLRFAWHLTSVAWLGFAALLAHWAKAPFPPSEKTLQLVAVTFFASGLLSFTYTRGRHFSWIVFWAIALLALFGIEG